MAADGKVLGYPTDGALLSAAINSGMDDLRKTYNRIEEIPFDSEKKYMAVKCDTDEGPVYFVKGKNFLGILPDLFGITWEKNSRSNDIHIDFSRQNFFPPKFPNRSYRSYVR